MLLKKSNPLREYETYYRMTQSNGENIFSTLGNAELFPTRRSALDRLAIIKKVGDPLIVKLMEEDNK